MGSTFILKYNFIKSNLEAEIKVLSNDGATLIATSAIITHTDGTQRVSLSWTENANTMYYIEVTGDSVMQFHIS